MLLNRSSKRTNLALGAVDAAVAALASLPESDHTRRLLAEAESCARGIHSWVDRPPTAEEREATMKRVLGLHVAIAALRREADAGVVSSAPEAPPSSDERPTDVPPFDVDEYASDSEARLRTVPLSESDVTLERMRDAFSRGQLEEALSIAQSLLDAAPLHAEARSIASRCAEELLRTYETELGPTAATPVLAITAGELSAFSLDEPSSALLHHIDGTASIAAVLQRAGLPRLVALRSLTGLCRRGIVSLR